MGRIPTKNYGFTQNLAPKSIDVTSFFSQKYGSQFLRKDGSEGLAAIVASNLCHKIRTHKVDLLHES